MFKCLLLFSRSVMFNSLQPMDCRTPGFPVLHHLPERVQTHVHWVSDAIQPSCPLSFPSPAVSLSKHCRLSYPGSQWAFSFTLPLGRRMYPANQCASYNLTALRPEHRDTLWRTLRTWRADSSSVCPRSQRHKVRAVIASASWVVSSINYPAGS